jgi:hypothetical protein
MAVRYCDSKSHLPHALPAGATLDIDCDRSVHAGAAHKAQQCQKWHARTGAITPLERGVLRPPTLVSGDCVRDAGGWGNLIT